MGVLIGRHIAFAALAVTGWYAGTAAAAELRNWFNDPFFQLTSHIPNCPMPAGPFVTDAEQRLLAHGRADRGTRCWLEKKCDRPTSYHYDRDIADAFADTFRSMKNLGATSLWVTMQRRIVFIEGCIHNNSDAPKLEAFALRQPYVQQAVVNVYSPGTRQPPYRLMHTGKP